MRDSAALILTLLIPLMLLLPVKSAAEDSAWQIGVIGEYGFGESSYELRVDDGTESVRSLLVFPMDTIYFGLEAHYENPSKSKQYSVRLLTNITTPAKKMIDEDWLDLTDSTEPSYIYTESNMEYRSLDLNLNGNWRLKEYRGFSLFFGAGYRLLWAHQLITDYQGYKLYDNDTKETISYTKADAIDYTIVYHIVDAGLLAEKKLGKKMDISIFAAPSAGLVFDRDDHLLRSKLSTGRGFGYGFILRGDVEVQAPETQQGFTPYLRIYGSYRWFFSPGAQRQYWYDDLDVVPEGTENNNLVHDVELIDPRLGISAGLRF